MPTTKTPARKPPARKPSPPKPTTAHAKTTPVAKPQLHGVPAILDRVLTFTEHTALRVALVAKRRRKLLHA